MRRFKALMNSSFAMLSQVMTILLQVINRRFFVLFLSKEYLGVNGLFADILNMLSVAELGLGSAIIFAMYKPFAAHNKKQVRALIRFYRNAYLKIGIIVTVVGISIIPFLDFFIKDPGGIEHIEYIYVIILLNTTVTYFFSYKITILTVAQENYIQSISNVAFRVLQLLGQMFILYQTQNYILYLLVQLACTLGNYIFLSIFAKWRYAEFFERNETCELEADEKVGLFKNIKALFVHRVSSFLVNGTDNMILSKFMGLATTGLFSNYNFIFNNVFNTFATALSSITSTVGNFVASESKESAQKMFWKMNFISYWLAVVCGTCLLNLSSPFVGLFFGKQYQLNDSVVVIMTFNFYLNVMRQPVNVYKNTKGLFWQDRFKPIIESMINLLVGILLVKYVGVLSVLLGTTISAMFAGLVIEVRIIYRYGFEVSSWEYYRRYLFDFCVAFLIGLFTWKVCELVQGNTIITLFLRLLICMIFSNIILFFCYKKTEESVYYRKFVKEILNTFKDKIINISMRR